MVDTVVGDDGGGVILLAAGEEVWFEIGTILVGGDSGRAEVGIERRGIGGGGEEGRRKDARCEGGRREGEEGSSQRRSGILTPLLSQKLNIESIL